MDERFNESHQAVLHAREALRRGDMAGARQWAERAAGLTPHSEEPWLILAAVASPRDSVEYVRKALQANPNSPRAKKGMEWALQRLREAPEGRTPPRNEKGAPRPARNGKARRPRKRSPLFPILLVLMGCAVFGFAAWSAATSPALASILSLSGVPAVQPTRLQPFAEVEIAKPTYTRAPTQLFTPAAGSLPTDPPTLWPTVTPTLAATFTPEPTSTPGTLYAEIVPDTPTPEYVAPTAAPQAAPRAVNSGGSGGVHWIDVDLSQQRVYAYEGDTVVNSFLASTGTWQTPTVTGKFKIWIKMLYTDMTGPGYYLPDVPYTMFFYKDYALHGTYWHNNFGTPMSHGCVNLSIPDAAWLYNFAYEGTVVKVHY
jgi:lipoprotein-anchoring transpeptidase ErfK/SrfK